MPARAGREIGERSAGVRRNGAHVTSVAGDVLGEVRAHREAGRVNVCRVEALVVGHVGLHGVDEREVVAGGRCAVACAADGLRGILHVPRVAERVGTILSVGKGEPDSLAVRERAVFSHVGHLLSAHPVAMEDEDEGEGHARVERRWQVDEVRPRCAGDREGAVGESPHAASRAAIGVRCIGDRCVDGGALRCRAIVRWTAAVFEGRLSRSVRCRIDQRAASVRSDGDMSRRPTAYAIGRGGRRAVREKAEANEADRGAEVHAARV